MAFFTGSPTGREFRYSERYQPSSNAREKLELTWSLMRPPRSGTRSGDLYIQPRARAIHAATSLKSPPCAAPYSRLGRPSRRTPRLFKECQSGQMPDRFASRIKLTTNLQ